MPDLPDELRDRAARAGHGVIFCGEPADSESDISWQQWLAIVDAVAGVLAEQLGEADKAFTDLCREFNDAQDEIIVLCAENADLKTRLAEGAEIVRRLISKEPSPEEWERAVRRGQEIYQLLKETPDA